VTYAGAPKGPDTTRAYLRARDLSTPAKAVAKRDRIISEWTTLQVQTALGAQFRHDARVLLRRPRWMPEAIYRRLLASIVVETRAAERVRHG
jgi:hypothetical protein